MMLPLCHAAAMVAATLLDAAMSLRSLFAAYMMPVAAFTLLADTSLFATPGASAAASYAVVVAY